MTIDCDPVFLWDKWDGRGNDDDNGDDANSYIYDVTNTNT